MTTGRVLALTITLLLLRTPSCLANGGDPGVPDCINPKGEYGNCIELLRCRVLFQILKARPLSRPDIKFLQKSTCGFTGGGAPKVCCVGFKEETTTTTTTSTTPAPPVSVSVRSPSLELAIDKRQEVQDRILRHPNLHLLPNLTGCGEPQMDTDRIIGGRTAQMGAYPWMALLAFKEEGEEAQLACGGTLISRRYVLTAAHCVSNLPPGFNLSFVRLGEYDQSQMTDCVDEICADPVQDIGIADTIVENYDLLKRKENDIALIRLRIPAKLGPFVSPICLPHLIDFNTARNAGNITKLIVAGWGRTMAESDKGSDILQELSVPIVSNQVCEDYYKKVGLGPIDDSKFCAGGELDKDSCKGDSGGPLSQAVPVATLRNSARTFQFGIVSMGPARCGSKDQPALYTRVAHFVPWILDHMKP